MTKHHTKKCKAVPFPYPPAYSKGNCLPPWSETRVEPDAQFCPIVSCVTPIIPIKTPIYTSSETPAPQWATNVIISPSVYYKEKGKHSKYAKSSPFLRTYWKDDIERYVYGKNPFSDTINAGGSHFQ